MARKLETILERDVDFADDELSEVAATIANFMKLYYDGKYERIVFRRYYRNDDTDYINLVGIRDETPEEAAQREADAAHNRQRELDKARELVARLEREIAGGK